METAEIVERIKVALRRCADVNNIQRKDIRVRISRKKTFIASTIKCDVLRNMDVIQEVSLKELLGINPIQAPLVNTYLGNALSKLAKSEGVSDESVNGRFFTTSEDFTPRLYLYNGVTPLREVKIEELLN